LQHDPAILPAMLDSLQSGADVVVGSRHVAGGSTGNWNRWRRLESWLATKTAQYLLGVPLKDPLSGYFLVRREDFAKVKEQLNGNGFKILLELLAKLQTSGVTEVPYTFQSRTHGASKLSNRVIFLYVQQLWRLCSASRHRSVRFLKSAMVGGVGIFANLAMMAILLSLTNLRDWRASAISCLAANFQNYLLNHFWSCANQSQHGIEKLKGYLTYFLLSSIGLGITFVSYATLTWILADNGLPYASRGIIPLLIRLSCQFSAVLIGIFFYYLMNRLFAGPDFVRMNFEAPESASSSFIELTERRSYTHTLDLDPEVGK
jgi:dolichol-phosphate mannosyltransferase